MGSRGPVKGQKRAKKVQPPAPPAKPKGKPPARPDYVAGYAACVWDDLAPKLHKLGLLGESDGPVLAGLCIAVENLEWSVRDIFTGGRTQTSLSGYEIARPAVAIQKQALEEIRRSAELFGLDPRSRTRVGGADAAPAANPLAALLGGIPAARAGG